MAKKILDLKYFEGGDIIDKVSKEQEIIEAVSKSENITTNEAIKKLNGLENNFKITKEDVKEVEIEPKEEEITLNLSEIVEFYHKKLYETQSVIDLLKGFNLDNTFWRLFKLGACNGKLLDITSQKQKEELKKTGLF